jgi:hypothetical protein
VDIRRRFRSRPREGPDRRGRIQRPNDCAERVRRVQKVPQTLFQRCWPASRLPQPGAATRSFNRQGRSGRSRNRPTRHNSNLTMDRRKPQERHMDARLISPSQHRNATAKTQRKTPTSSDLKDWPRSTHTQRSLYSWPAFQAGYGFVSPSIFASWASTILVGRSLGRVQFLKRCGMTA